MEKENQNLTNTKDDVQTESLDISDISDSGSADETLRRADASDFEKSPAGESGSQSDPTPSADVAKRRRIVDKIVTISLIIAICVLACVILLKIFVIGKITISGTSMEPNFHSGETVWVNKSATPQRGDVVVFYLNDVDKFQAELFAWDSKKGGIAEKYIKRVVALGGDKLWTEQKEDDFVLIIQTSDGRILREDYYTVNGQRAQFFDIEGSICNTAFLGELGILADATEENPYVVAENCFFALGDNRHNSADSRRIGDVPLSRLFGVVQS